MKKQITVEIDDDQIKDITKELNEDFERGDMQYSESQVEKALARFLDCHIQDVKDEGFVDFFKSPRLERWLGQPEFDVKREADFERADMARDG